MLRSFCVRPPNRTSKHHDAEVFRPGRHFQDTRVARLYEGTDEILTLKIAAAVLGKE